jgi:hypothetical protein
LLGALTTRPVEDLRAYCILNPYGEGLVDLALTA